MASLIQFFDALRIPGLEGWQILLLTLALLGVFGYVSLNLLIIKTFLTGLTGFFKDSFKVFIPTKWDSSRTLIGLGFFSWAMSMISGQLVQNMIAISGWLFLIPGVHWAMYEDKNLNKLLTVDNFLTINKTFFGPWITGALISFFLFADPQAGVPSIAFVMWPIFSAALAALPKFIFYGPTYKRPEVKFRQDLVLMVLTNLLLTCWIQLSFSTQNWLTQYPSLQADNLHNSSFVIAIQRDPSATSRGATLLQRAEDSLKASLDGQAWPQVERWLINFDDRVQDIQTELQQRPARLAEDIYWQLNGRVLAGEYNVELYALWQGPTAEAKSYYLSKTCQITAIASQNMVRPPVATAPINANIGTAKVQCGPVSEPRPGEPDRQSLRNQPLVKPTPQPTSPSSLRMRDSRTP
jgi:Family of unknown function (DUF5357)